MPIIWLDVNPPKYPKTWYSFLSHSHHHHWCLVAPHSQAEGDDRLGAIIGLRHTTQLDVATSTRPGAMDEAKRAAQQALRKRDWLTQ